MKPICVIDNYDSFTYNLVHYLEEYYPLIEVHRNDEFEPLDVEQYSAIVLSPGPGLPKDAGRLMEILNHAVGKIPILGVCLGLQAIGIHFGWKLMNQERVKHGIAEKNFIKIDTPLFSGLPASFNVGLYHSWCLDPASANDQLLVTSVSENEVIMSVEHEIHPIYGVQFHPESILTNHGKEIILNFLSICGLHAVPDTP